MTLIEIFDRFAPENIAGCLHLQPEKLIFVGDQAQIEPFLPRCRAFLAQRGIAAQVVCRPVPLEQVEKIVAELARILREETQCVIDIAGGDERILMAVGVALTGLDRQQREKVTVQKLDLETGTVQTLHGCGETVAQIPVDLQVREMVQLQGGVLHPTTIQPAARYTAADLDGLWDLVCRDPRAWNRRLSFLGELEKRADSKQQVFLPLRAIRGSIKDFENKLTQVRALLADLRACGAIRDHSRGDHLEYTYTSPLMRACTLKAGNALETKALLEARTLQLDGKPYFHDCQMGVHIDWDGQVHNTKQIPETRNEVDLILMRGMTPLFVSCKNGDVEEEELYKLHTVATRFGGDHARKMLIATALGGSCAEGCSLRQRAADMGITLVTDAVTLSKQDWQDIFMQAMQRGGAAPR